MRLSTVLLVGLTAVLVVMLALFLRDGLTHVMDSATTRLDSLAQPVQP